MGKTLYLLGVDTGSSKTHAMITTSDGKVLGFGESGCGNYEVVGYDLFRDAVEEAVNQALITAKMEKDEISAMGFGISGYDWPSEEPLMKKAIESLGIQCDYRFVNDVMIGLMAGSSEGWGVAVDAGAGNNVRGINQAGKIGRITGNSVYSGEIGGGGEMVWLAQIAVTHAWTGRGPKTSLTEAFIDFAKVETEFTLIESFCTNQIHIPPSFAEVVFRLAASGDEVSIRIINTAAQELAFNTNAVIKQLDLENDEFEIVLIGSVFKAGEIYLQPFRQTIHAFAPAAKLVQLSVPPVTGSLLLAAEMLGIPIEKIKPTLLKSLKQFIGDDIQNLDLN